VLLESAQFIVTAGELYAAAGFTFALIFLSIGIARLDPGVAAAPKTLRLLLLPGVAALWPLFASRWIRGAKPPIERNPHRAVAR
jgi:hypothetical protein